MANIETYLQQILAAIYGEDVREAIHDAIQEINNVVQNWESGLMDTTLTSATLPAQGKAVGDALNKIIGAKCLNVAVTSSNVGSYPDADTFPNRSIINVMASANVAHKPFESCTIITTGFSTTDTAPYGGSKQIALNNNGGGIATRSHNGTSWSAWIDVIKTISDTISSRAGFQCSSIYVTSSNVGSYPDADTFPNRSIINILASANVAHKPFESCTIITTGFSTTDTAPYGGSKQIALNNNGGGIATRSHDGNAWSEWWLPINEARPLINNVEKQTGMRSMDIIVTSSNVGSYPDADTFPNRSIINILASANVAHKPFESCTIITTGFSTTGTAPYGGSKQIALSNLTGVIATRSNTGSAWSDWHYQTNIIYADPSNFIEKIDDAILTSNTVVYLSSGDYYLFDSVHNESYWKNKRIATRYCGLLLKFGVKLIGLGNVTFNAVYSGDDEDIKENFSVFNIGGDCEINNIDVIGQNICYLVHDDPPISNSVSNSFIISGCKLVHNGSNHTFTSGAPMCIGAGETTHTYREYINNIIKSTYDRSVNIHTKTGGNGKYFISGNYFLTGTLGFTEFGDGSGTLEAVISNNSLPAQIVDRSSGGAVLLQMNNIIR